MRNRDLWVLAALAAAGVVAQLGPVPAPLRAILGAPLVLVCPGYALVAALFPSRSLGWPERIVLSLGLSVAVAILGVVALNGSPWGLQTAVWVGLFFAVTLAASLVAARRRGAPAPAQTGRPPARVGLGPWLGLGLAGVVAVAAVAVARLPGPVTNVLGYTVLWMTPDAATSGATDPNSIQLGVINSEFTPTGYRLQLTLNGQVLLDQPDIELAPGATWQQQFELPQTQAGAVVEAQLYLLDDPSDVYRRVSLRR